MAIGTPWVGAAVQGNVAGSNVLTATVDVSGATNGEIVFIIGALSNAELANITPPAGWNSFSQMAEGTAASTSTRAIVFWKVKASSDTTVTITDATNWTNTCRAQFVPISWPGVNTTTPAESVAWATRTALGTTYATGSGTPTLGDRWAVGVFLVRGTTANTAWTSDAALTGVRATPGTTATPFFSLLVADSAAAVTQAAHTYTATGQSASHGIGGVFYLIPATTGAIAAAPTGISSGEAFGAPVATAGTLTAAPTGITSAEAFGTVTAAATLTATPTGIATSEALGAPTATVTLSASPTGIPSAEATGAPTATASLTSRPSGVASGEQVGTPTATASLTASPAAIGTGEAFGTPAVVTSGAVAPAGIPTGEAFGVPTATVASTVAPTGIPTGELFGAPSATTGLVAAPAGIPSGEGFGQPTIAGAVAPTPGVLVATNTAASQHTATQALSSDLAAANPYPDLAPSNIPSSQLEVSHGV